MFALLLRQRFRAALQCIIIIFIQIVSQRFSVQDNIIQGVGLIASRPVCKLEDFFVVVHFAVCLKDLLILDVIENACDIVLHLLIKVRGLFIGLAGDPVKPAAVIAV